MARPAEIPQLASELFDLSKQYLDQEAVQPLRTVGRYLGLSLGGGALLAMGWLFLSIAALRLVTDLLPEGVLWSTLAYVITAVAAAGLAGILVKYASSRGTPR
jgi:uncharacterized membrane protein YuzA (DUF378 family)